MAYHGKQFKGAARQHKQIKREEAEARNELTLPERRRAYRKAQHAARISQERRAA